MYNLSLDAGVEETILSATFNGPLLANLLFGTHTAIYFYTLYLYLTKKPSRRSFVVGCLTLSYIAYLAQIVAQWDFATTSLINHGQTRESALVDAFVVRGPKGSFTSEVTKFVLTDLADLLMIWRCYFVWNGSFRIIALPCLFLFCKTALDFAAICILSTSHLVQTDPAHRLVGSGLFMTFFTNLVTTALIAYRINSVGKDHLSPGSRALFQHILDILVQSSAVYCIVSFAFAVSVTLATEINGSLNHRTAILYSTQAFIDVLFTFTACSAPAVMVARIALLPETDATSIKTAKISGLQFHAEIAPSNSETATQTSAESMNLQDGQSPSAEPKAMEVKEEHIIHVA